LIGGRWRHAGDIVRDVSLGAGLWLLWKGLSEVIVRVAGPGQAASIDSLLPRNALEIALWIPLSITAGISEEIVFRGYFQRQFTALTRNRWLAVVLQAVLFGVSHGYQGVAASVMIALYGGLFGLLAVWRGSLRPGILAHSMTDILAGIFRI
jgi:membrane protease YdiL (CAAX protease family)